MICIKQNKKARHEISERNPVPLYRSYGVTRKEYSAIETLKMWLERIVAAFFLLIPATALTLGLVAVLIYSNALTKVVLWTVIIYLVLSAITKKARIRLKLNRKIKKCCKNNRFDLDFERKFFESLKWSDDGCDLTVETASRIYYIHTLYVTKARQKILFESAEAIKLITPPPRGRLWTVLGIIFNLKTRTKALSVNLSGDRSIGKKEGVSVILVLPGCQNMSYRISSASTVPTGNGGEHFGYTVFTAKGLINFLPRYEENLRQSRTDT